MIDRSRTEAASAAVPLLLDSAGPYKTLGNERGEPLVTIRAADSEGQRSSAHILVNRMYATRGYTTAPLPENSNSNRITLVAFEHESAVGTITVGFDGTDGLLVDETFGDVARKFRDEGEILCEFIKLAIDGVVRSKKVLASLMHAALICAREIQNCDRALIEVNPRHVRFYESMLGFTVLVRERHNPRVNAPAVLMALDLAFAHDQIDEVHDAGPSYALTKRSLYHQGFSREESAAVAGRLRRSSACSLRNRSNRM